MANVAYVRPELSDKLELWKKIDDVLAGPDAMREAGDAYLPRPNASDTSPENRARFDAYLKRATFYAVTKRTHRGLVGHVFQKEPTVELPSSLEPLIADADGSGVTLQQQAKKALGHVLGYARAGLFVDYPATENPTTKAQLKNGQIRPTILLYNPRDVINWRLRSVGAVQQFRMIVFRESYQKSDDGFEPTFDTQYRQLYLDKDGFYAVNIWQELTDSKTGKTLDLAITSSFTPLDAKGRRMDYIPFTFIGALSNDAEVEDSPIEDMVELNIGHWRNSADYEESVFFVGQPTPVVTGLTESWVKDVLKGTLPLGSRAVIPLPAGASASLLQPGPNVMAKEAMETKERQMIALGARLVEQRAVQRTLGEARLAMSTEVSILESCSNNVESAFRKALEWCQAFTGEEGEIVFELNSGYELGKLTPEELDQLLKQYEAKGLSFTEYRSGLKRSGLAYQEDEEAKTEIEENMDFGVPEPPPMVVADTTDPNNPNADPAVVDNG